MKNHARTSQKWIEYGVWKLISDGLAAGEEINCMGVSLSSE